ncbi:MAG: ATP-binding cassette domain-containing protein [Bacteroidales bacterium]|nr:ATP-binding cassette domain-containing protein [Bacteroidales bacterium]
MGNETVIQFINAAIYQKDIKVLENVNLSIHKGELVYLIGKVGSGKSSLIKSIYAEPHLNGGELYVSDYQIHKIKEKEIPYLRRKIGIVFQDFQLLSDRSIEENLLFVLKATGWTKRKLMDIRIQEVLENVKLFSKLHNMPHQLSGGEQQRIVIARALLNSPEIIVADEPTGNLDPESSEEIMKTLIQLQDSGRAIIIASHDYLLLRKYPAKTYRCENGMVQEIDFSSIQSIRE